MEGEFKKFINEKKDEIKKGLVIGVTALSTMAPAAEVAAQDSGSDKHHITIEAVGNPETQTVFDKEYKTDEHFFRAVSQGVSPDVSTAKKIAEMNARKEITEQIAQGASEITETKNITTINEKLFLNADGTYTYWVAVEMAK